MGALREFIAMGGYAGFVWPAFGVVAVVLIGLLAVSVRGMKSKEMALADASADARMRIAERWSETRPQAADRSSACGIGLLAVAVALVLTALDDTLVFFQDAVGNRCRRVGRGATPARRRPGRRGQRRARRRRYRRLSHHRPWSAVPVRYTGILPDLFREGQGVVVEGRLRDGVLIADQVLAKHDERYMPPEVAEALKQSGQWQHMRESLQEAGQLPAQPGAAAR